MSHTLTRTARHVRISGSGESNLDRRLLSMCDLMATLALSPNLARQEKMQAWRLPAFWTAITVAFWRLRELEFAS